jgi:hypothetical protein
VKEIDYYGIEDEATYHVPKDEWVRLPGRPHVRRRLLPEESVRNLFRGTG